MIQTTTRLAAACLLAGASLAHAATSTFDTGSEGWTAVGDAAGPLTWSAMGGNPGGHVQIPDQVIGGITYFVAPESFLGNQSSAYGTMLGFDLKQDYPGASNQFDSADVILQGGGLTLVYDTPYNPPNGSWVSYAIPLAAGGWRIDSLSGAAASGEQIQSVLANLSSLRIRAEFQTGADTGSLDNVSLVPEPSTFVLFVAGAACVLSGRARRRQPA